MWIRRNLLLDDLSSICRGFDNMLRDVSAEGQSSWPSARLLVASPGHEPRSPSPRNWGLEYPAVSSFQRDGAIVVRAELPGVKAGDVEVEVADGKLLIKGEKKTQRQEKEPLYLEETYHGRFQRAFTLPRGTRADQVQARLENGVLEVTIPAEGLKEAARKVPIKVLDEDEGGEKKKLA